MTRRESREASTLAKVEFVELSFLPITRQPKGRRNPALTRTDGRGLQKGRWALHSGQRELCFREKLKIRSFFGKNNAGYPPFTKTRGPAMSSRLGHPVSLPVTRRILFCCIDTKSWLPLRVGRRACQLHSSTWSPSPSSTPPDPPFR